MGGVPDLSIKMTYKSYWFIAIRAHEILVWFCYGRKFSLIGNNREIFRKLSKSLCSFQTQEIPINVQPESQCDRSIFNNYMFNVKLLLLNNVLFMHKIPTKTAPSMFHSRFQRPSHYYPTNFSECNYSLPTLKKK